MHSRYWRLAINILILPLLVCPFLLGLPTGQAYGDPFLDLQLDDPAVIRWDISNIAPGDSGLQPINLYNTGNVTGYVYIWIDDLVDDEGLNPEPETGDTTNPGELSHYISLDIINEGMTLRKLSGTGRLTGIMRPVMLDSFPASSDEALYIASPPVGANETLELQWQWEFVPTAGNEAQGDTASFSVYYMLGPQCSGGGGGGGGLSPPEEEPVSPPSDETPVSADNVTSSTLPARKFVSDDGRCVISIPADTRVMTESDGELQYVVIDIPDEVPPLPEPFKLITPVYRIIVHTDYNILEGTRLKQPVILTIYYDTDKIPENAEVSIISYNPDSGWGRLYCFGEPSGGRLTAWVNYVNLVAVVVIEETDIEAPVEPAVPAPEDIPPAPEEKPVGAEVQYTEITSDNLEPLRHASLGIAVSGSVAMLVLSYIQRRRRARMKGTGDKAG
jgi:hypothetical protein